MTPATTGWEYSLTTRSPVGDIAPSSASVRPRGPRSGGGHWRRTTRHRRDATLALCRSGRQGCGPRGRRRPPATRGDGRHRLVDTGGHVDVVQLGAMRVARCVDEPAGHAGVRVYGLAAALRDAAHRRTRRVREERPEGLPAREIRARASPSRDCPLRSRCARRWWSTGRRHGRARRAKGPAPSGWRGRRDRRDGRARRGRPAGVWETDCRSWWRIDNSSGRSAFPRELQRAVGHPPRAGAAGPRRARATDGACQRRPGVRRPPRTTGSGRGAGGARAGVEVLAGMIAMVPGAVGAHHGPPV